MTLATLFPLLAQADKLDASNPTVFMGMLIAAVGALALTADRIDSMIQRRKRQPSVDVDLKGLESSIATLTSTVEQLLKAKEDHNGHKERIAALEERCRRLEAEKVAYEASQRSYLAKTTREWFDRIEKVESTVSNNFKDVERGLGKVEGALEQIAQRVAEATRAAAEATRAANEAASAASRG